MVILKHKTAESANRTQVVTIPVPDLQSISKITVNTGTVRLVETLTNSIKVEVSDGSYTRRVQTGGSYTPGDSKTVTDSRTSSKSGYVICNPSGTWPSNPGFAVNPESISYSSGGYSGTLSKVSNSVSGIPTGACSSGDAMDFTSTTTSYYSGTVTKSGSDTRTYQNYYEYEVSVDYVKNAIPVIQLTTSDNRTLYENDTFIIAGTVVDRDIDDVVTVRYAINTEAPKTLTASVSTGATVPFNRTLTFKNKKLFDGTSVVGNDLVENANHTLRVWAEDDKGGRSSEITRTFKIISNRPPVITFDALPNPTGKVDTDIITITGKTTDPDGNTVTAQYRVNDSAYADVVVQSGGTFTFEFPVNRLLVGVNTITLKATDSYGAVSQKVLQFNKKSDVTPLKKSVTRYKLTPPNGSAKGAILWVNRDAEDMEVSASISMVASGEPTSFQPMTKTVTAYVDDGVEEDEFTYEADTTKEDIVIQITQTRTNVTKDVGISLISGVLS